MLFNLIVIKFRLRKYLFQRICLKFVKNISLPVFKSLLDVLKCNGTLSLELDMCDVNHDCSFRNWRPSVQN